VLLLHSEGFDLIAEFMKEILQEMNNADKKDYITLGLFVNCADLLCKKESNNKFVYLKEKLRGDKIVANSLVLWEELFIQEFTAAVKENENFVEEGRTLLVLTQWANKMRDWGVSQADVLNFVTKITENENMVVDEKIVKQFLAGIKKSFEMQAQKDVEKKKQEERAFKRRSRLETSDTLGLAGYLFKKGGLRKKFQKRYFVQKGDLFYYYLNDKATQENELGYIACTDIVSVHGVPKSKVMFEIHTKYRKYELKAPTSEAKSYWIQGIRQLLEITAATTKK